MASIPTRLVALAAFVAGLGIGAPLPDTGLLDVVTTELCPAVLVRSSAADLTLFDNTDSELGGPTRLAVPTRGATAILRQGESMAGMEQERPWLLAWYAGAKGWTTWDVPMLVILQHRAQEIRLAPDGLRLSFQEQAGDVVIMPLYGSEKLPQAGADFSAFPAAPPAMPATWEEGLPKDVMGRCGALSLVLRAFPVYTKEEFALDGTELRVRNTVQFHRIEDDWHTPAMPMAPLPPILGLAWEAGRDRHEQMPMQMPAVTDPGIATPYGPWVGFQDRESYTIAFPLLHYVQQTAANRDRPETSPAAIAAQERLRQIFGWKFADGKWDKIWDHGSAKNFCWQAMGDRWYAKAIPYLPPEARERTKQALRGYMREFVLQPERFTPYRDVLQLFGPGIGAWGGYDDAGKFSANLLETLWNYAHFTGDTETICENWPLIRKLFVTPYECDWKSFGRYSIAEMGDEAAPAIAMARLAHLAGDEAMSDFASYIAVGELMHHYVKSLGNDYFRRHQPLHSMEPIPEQAWPTNLWGHIAGWQIDGPTYPEKTRERQYTNRWVRFSDADVGWFHHDYLLKETTEELDDLARRAADDPKGRWQLTRDTAHIMPSLVRLRRLLLNDSPEELAALAPENTWKGGRAPDQIAFLLSFLEWRPERGAVRLIPEHRTDYQPGLERLRETHYAGLCMSVRSSAEAPVPLLTAEPVAGLEKVQGLRAPHPVRFGTVHPGNQALGTSDRSAQNWNTVLIRCR